MKIKTRLHASQLYLPKDFLDRLSLDKESEVILELDEDNQRIIVQTQPAPGHKNPTEWILNAMEHLPTGEGDTSEDFHEYDFEDI